MYLPIDQAKYIDFLENLYSYLFTRSQSQKNGDNLKRLLSTLVTLLLSFALVPLATTAAQAAGEPNSPVDVGSTGGDGELWVGAYPATDGPRPTTFVFTASPGGGTCTATLPAVNCVITGLTNGTAYTISAIAHNAAGDSASVASPWSATPSTAVTITGAAKNCSSAGWAVQPCYNYNGTTDITVYGYHLETCTSILGFGGGYWGGVAVTPAIDGKSATFTLPQESGAYGWAMFNCGLTQNSFIVAAISQSGQFITPSWTSNSGALNNNQTVMLTTNSPHWVDVTSVAIDGVSATFQVLDYQHMNVTIPTGTSTGSKDVTIVNMGGTGTLTSAYTYTAAVAVTPGAPGKPSAVAGDGQATITISAPSTGDAPTSYLVTASPGGATCTVYSPDTSCTVTGLTNGTSYTFTSTATNNGGTSTDSVASDAVTPAGSGSGGGGATAPNAPTSPLASAGDGKATVSWTSPATGDAPTSYTVTAHPGGATCTVNAPATSCVVSGLTNGTSYYFTVTASNDAGTSDPSSTSNNVTPKATPKAPTTPVRPSASAGDGKATISVPVTKNVDFFEIISVPGGLVCKVVAPDNSCDIEGLTNGTSYTFVARAFGPGGSSLLSEPSDPVTPGAKPGTPGAPSIEAGDGQLKVTVKPGVGAPAKSYIVTAAPGGTTCMVVVPALTCVLTGLTNGVEYTVTVTAKNDTGVSGNSSAAKGTPVAPVVPVQKPATPGTPGVTGGNQQLTVTVLPGTGGGAATSYLATAQPGGANCRIVAPATNCVITGLAAGTRYSVTVVATNVAGNSESSVAGSAATDGIAKVNGFVDGNANGSLDKARLDGFAGGSYALTVELRSKLDAMVGKLKGATSITCIGYTSGPDIQPSDRKLALARAKAVCLYLQTKVSTIESFSTLAKPTTALGAAARKVEVLF